MELGIPYAKTEAARALLRARDATLTPPLRALLIMIDGKKPVTDLLPAIKALSLKAEDVHGLLSRGLGFNTGVQFMGYYTAVLSVPALLKLF